VSGVSWNHRGFVKCVAIQKRLGIPALVLKICFNIILLSMWKSSPQVFFSGMFYVFLTHLLPMCSTGSTCRI
jgi:hypothetical protein